MSLPARWAAVAAAFVVLLCAASTASAATFSQPNGGLSYDAAAGETNDLTIANPASGVWDFADPGATITPAGPCVQGSDVHHAHCTGVTGLITANLGDGDDDATFSGALAGPQTGVFLFGQDGRDDLTGSPGADVMVGDTFQGFDDSLDGGAGDDQLTGGPGADLLTGGPGEDSTTYSPPYNTGPVTVTVGNGAADDGNPVDDASTGGVPGTLDDVEVEDVTGTLWGGDHLTGDDDANVLREDLCCGTDPPAGSTIEGAGGNDRLIGSAAADVLVGGPGTDDFFAKAGDDRVEAADGVGESVLCDAGDDSGHADVTDGLDQCEDVIVTSSVPPPTPAQPTTTPGDGQVALDWPAVTGATHYTVTQWEQPTPAETTTVDRATNHHDALDLANGHTYCWTITALNPAGASSPSPAACATPQAASSPPVPGMPSRPAVQLVNASHDPKVGEPLKFTPAVFTGTPTPTVTYQWMRCPNTFVEANDTATGCTAIKAATPGSTYTLAVDDIGSFIAVRAHAVNTAGSRDRDSQLLGRVTGTAPIATFAKSSVDFGYLESGKKQTRTLSVRNTGGNTMHLSGVSISAGGFTSTGCASGTLAPNETCNLSITFAPNHNGPYGATLRLKADVPGGGATLPLKGIGLVAGASTDTRPPVITVTSPTATVAKTGPKPLSFSCSETRPGDSGVASCSAALDGAAIANGAALPQSGKHTVHVVATDLASPAHVATTDVTYSVAKYTVNDFPPQPPKPEWYLHPDTGRLMHCSDSGLCNVVPECDPNNNASYSKEECDRKTKQVLQQGATAIDFNVAPSLISAVANLGSSPLDSIYAWKVISSGGGNVISSGGGNVIASGGGNVISSGGANVIDHDKGHVVKVFGNPFVPVSFPQGEHIEIHPVGDVIASGGGNVISSGGGNVISSGGGNVIASGGGNVFGEGAEAAKGAGVIQQGSGNIVFDVPGWAIRDSKGQVIASGGGNLLGDAAYKVISSGGGNVISSGGGNVIASGGGNFHIADGNHLIGHAGGNVTDGNVFLGPSAAFVPVFNGVPSAITQTDIMNAAGTVSMNVVADRSVAFARPAAVAGAARVRRVTLATATAKAKRPGVVVLRLRFTKAGRALLRNHHRLKRGKKVKPFRVTVTTKVKPRKGKAVTVTKRFKVKPHRVKVKRR